MAWCAGEGARSPGTPELVGTAASKSSSIRGGELPSGHFGLLCTSMCKGKLGQESRGRWWIPTQSPSGSSSSTKPAAISARWVSVRVGGQNVEVAEQARAIRIAGGQLRAFEHEHRPLACVPHALEQEGRCQRRSARGALLVKQEKRNRSALLLEHVCR